MRTNSKPKPKERSELVLYLLVELPLEFEHSRDQLLVPTAQALHFAACARVHAARRVRVRAGEATGRRRKRARGGRGGVALGLELADALGALVEQLVERTDSDRLLLRRLTQLPDLVQVDFILTTRHNKRALSSLLRGIGTNIIPMFAHKLIHNIIHKF